MRQKFDPQLYFIEFRISNANTSGEASACITFAKSNSWAVGTNSKIVIQYMEKYNRIGNNLDENPEILDSIHTDLKKLTKGGSRGRKATYTTENFLSALIVIPVKALS